MIADNFDAVLSALKSRRPFRVFAVELRGGTRFEFEGPQTRVVRDGVAVVLRPGGIALRFDHDSVTQIIGDTAENAA